MTTQIYNTLNHTAKTQRTLSNLVRGLIIFYCLIASTFSSNTSVKAAATQQSQTPPSNEQAVVSATTLNQAATLPATKFIVSSAGLQQITGQALLAAGLNINTIDPTQLHLTYRGQSVALELVNLDAMGKLTANSSIRFYAAVVGDRWNSNSLYWLTIEPTAGKWMETRSVTPAGALARDNAFESGLWESKKQYSSVVAGDDGDHWFQQSLQPASETDLGSTGYMSLTGQLSALPGSAAIFTVHSTVTRRGDFVLNLNAENVTIDHAWNSENNDGDVIPNWKHDITVNAQANRLQVTLLSRNSPFNDAELLLNRVTWQRPVLLNFQQKGGRFAGVEGMWHYRWQNPPAQLALYDVTIPEAPVRLSNASAEGFQDGPSVRDYLLVDTNQINVPMVSSHQPVSILSETNGADALYIAPATFHNALQPLLTHRRNQGYRVALVDVQQIYDAWSYGEISPQAIRSFIRYARDHWQAPALQSVVLVGDGTYDPKNYEGKNNPLWIPPYLENVDPWLKETACEACFVQLDGENPVTGDGERFHADLWLGRLPVNSVEDVTNYVTKLLAYETTPMDSEAWRTTSALVADNFILEMDTSGNPVYDGAGDFAAISDKVVEQQPKYITPQRFYYDPYKTYNDPMGNDIWRNTDHLQMRKALLDTLNFGAGLLTYNGHGFQHGWGRADASSGNDTALLNKYDVDQLKNDNKPFVLLDMVCLTGQFHKPMYHNATIDERMLLHPRGGAIAVWSGAGLSLADGHEDMQRGFHQTLWAAEAGTAKIGALLAAGYKEVEGKACCSDVLMTFQLLGDPLMTLKVGLVGRGSTVDEETLASLTPRAYLPVVTR